MWDGGVRAYALEAEQWHPPDELAAPFDNPAYR